MPRHVRNFWIEANIDGRSSKFSGGPASKDGGFTLTVYIRREGDVSEAVTLVGKALSTGTLLLDIEVPDETCADVLRDGTRLPLGPGSTVRIGSVR